MKSFLSIILFVILSLENTFAQCAQIDSLYRVLRIAKSDTDKINTLNNLAQELALIGKDGQAAFYAKQSLKMSEEADYPKGIADALTHIAKMDYADMKDLGENIEAFQKALSIYKDLNDQPKIIQTLEIIGTYYYKHLDAESHKKAIEYYKEALSLLEKQGDKEKIARTYESLGTLYATIEEDEQALNAYKAAIDIRKKMGTLEPSDERIWMKYKRLSTVEKRLQKTNVFVLIMAFGIIIAVLLVVTAYSIIQKNKVHKNLQQLEDQLRLSNNTH